MKEILRALILLVIGLTALVFMEQRSRIRQLPTAELYGGA